VAGERVIVLSAATMTRVELSTAKLNTTDFFRGVTAGGILANAQQKSLIHTLASAKPYSPCHIEGTLGSPQDWLLNWTRRTRIGGAWLDLIDAPLSEASENYEVDILNGSTVVRTITTTVSANGSIIDASAKTAWYTQADQVMDFGSVQTSLSIVVYQISESVGRGFGRSATLLAA
jgi:hypothetical protein